MILFALSGTRILLSIEWTSLHSQPSKQRRRVTAGSTREVWGEVEWRLRNCARNSRLTILEIHQTSDTRGGCCVCLMLHWNQFLFLQIKTLQDHLHLRRHPKKLEWIIAASGLIRRMVMLTPSCIPSVAETPDRCVVSGAATWLILPPYIHMHLYNIAPLCIYQLPTGTF